MTCHSLHRGSPSRMQATCTSSIEGGRMANWQLVTAYNVGVGKMTVVCLPSTRSQPTGTCVKLASTIVGQ